MPKIKFTVVRSGAAAMQHQESANPFFLAEKNLGEHYKKYEIKTMTILPETTDKGDFLYRANKRLEGTPEICAAKTGLLVNSLSKS